MNRSGGCQITWEDDKQETPEDTGPTRRVSRGTLRQEAKSERIWNGFHEVGLAKEVNGTVPQSGVHSSVKSKEVTESLDVFTSPFRALAESCGFKVIREEESSDTNSERSQFGGSVAACSLGSDDHDAVDQNGSCRRERTARTRTRRGTPAPEVRVEPSVSPQNSEWPETHGVVKGHRVRLKKAVDRGDRSEQADGDTEAEASCQRKKDFKHGRFSTQSQNCSSSDWHVKHRPNFNSSPEKTDKVMQEEKGSSKDLREDGKTRGKRNPRDRERHHRLKEGPEDRRKNKEYESNGNGKATGTHSGILKLEQSDSDESVMERSDSGTYCTVQQILSPPKTHNQFQQHNKNNDEHFHSRHDAKVPLESNQDFHQSASKEGKRRAQILKPTAGRSQKVFMEMLPRRQGQGQEIEASQGAEEQKHGHSSAKGDYKRSKYCWEEKRAQVDQSLANHTLARGKVERGKLGIPGGGAAFRISRKLTMVPKGSECGVMRYFRSDSVLAMLNPKPKDHELCTERKSLHYETCKRSSTAAERGAGDGNNAVEHCTKIAHETDMNREMKATYNGNGAANQHVNSKPQNETDSRCEKQNNKESRQTAHAHRSQLDRHRACDHGNRPDSNQQWIQKTKLEEDGDHSAENPELLVLSEISKLRARSVREKSQDDHGDDVMEGKESSPSLPRPIHIARNKETNQVWQHHLYGVGNNQESNHDKQKHVPYVSQCHNEACNDLNMCSTSMVGAQSKGPTHIHLHGSTDPNSTSDAPQHDSSADKLAINKDGHMMPPFKNYFQKYEDLCQGEQMHMESACNHQQKVNTQHNEVHHCQHIADNSCYHHKPSTTDLGENAAQTELRSEISKAGDFSYSNTGNTWPQTSGEDKLTTSIATGASNCASVTGSGEGVPQVTRTLCWRGPPSQAQRYHPHHHMDFGFNVNSNYEGSEEGEGANVGSRFIGQYFLELWKNQCLCDVRLRVGNWSYLAHKIVLAAFSDYFCPNDPHCMPSVCFDIPNATPDAVHQILSYLYTSEMEITDYTLESVLCAAESLGVSEVINLVKEILENPTPENFEHYLEIRNRHGFPSRLTDYTDLIREHLLDLTTSTHFLELDLCELQQILGDPEVKVDSECDIIDVIARWIEYIPLERIAYSADLLSFVNFDCIPADCLADVVERKRHVFSRDAFSIFLDAFKARSINAECPPTGQTLWNNGNPAANAYTNFTPNRPTNAINKSTNADIYRPVQLPPQQMQLPIYDPNENGALANGSHCRGVNFAGGQLPDTLRPQQTIRRETTSRIPRSSQGRISTLLSRPSSAGNQPGRPPTAQSTQSWASDVTQSRPSTGVSSQGRGSGGLRRLSTTQNRQSTPREIMSMACRGDCDTSSCFRPGKQHRVSRGGGGGRAAAYAFREPTSVPSDTMLPAHRSRRGSMYRCSNGNAAFSPPPNLDMNGTPGFAPPNPAPLPAGVVAPVWEEAPSYNAPSTSPGWSRGSRGSSPAYSFVASPWPSPGVVKEALPPGCSTFRVVRGGRGPRWEQRSRSPSVGNGSRDRSASKRVTFM
ncbi:kelch-like protein 9 [Plakobranchus ocellatus]|uniref:Kelch-like protein 9 n=1 Tax=Plakobranchus ocellatus TaxID=259542 RepID=A0AAV4BB62_9GAST|nr:kelch-like protein 9 [Plakobranchus ocellatus]